jgi:hypothetical protein
LAGPGVCGSKAATDGWRYELEADGTFKLVSMYDNRYCLDQEQTANGRKPAVTPCSESLSQRWKLGYASTTVGSYVNLANNLCLTAHGPAYTGTVTLEPCNGQADEFWYTNGTL